MPCRWVNLGTSLFVVTAWFGFLLLSCCFAFAGAAWAAYSLDWNKAAMRRSGIVALLANLIAGVAVAAYLLVFTGVIRI